LQAKKKSFIGLAMVVYFLRIYVTRRCLNYRIKALTPKKKSSSDHLLKIMYFIGSVRFEIMDALDFRYHFVKEFL